MRELCTFGFYRHTYRYTSIGMPGIKLALLKACMDSHHSCTAPPLQNAVFACAVKTTSLSLFWFYSTKLKSQNLLIFRCYKLDQLHVNPQGHNWRGTFCGDPITQSSFQLFCQRKGTQKQLIWQLEDVYSDTYTQPLFMLVKAKPVNTQSIFLLCAPLQLFSVFSPNCTIQTITCKNSSLQSEDDKIWVLSNHICNLQS